MLSSDQIDQMQRLIRSAGLVKVWDGEAHVDAREIMAVVFEELRNAYRQLDGVPTLVSGLEAKVVELEMRLDEAHAEVQRLSAAIRGE